jgi:hypothetical protein
MAVALLVASCGGDSGSTDDGGDGAGGARDLAGVDLSGPRLDFSALDLPGPDLAPPDLAGLDLLGIDLAQSVPDLARVDLAQSVPDLARVDLAQSVPDLARVDLAQGAADLSVGPGCLAGPLLGSLGKSHLLVGAQMADATAKLAPFDVRYLYLAGGLFDGSAPCASCASGCTAGGTTCANTGPGCAWWGCWQWDQQPPGQYALGFISTDQSNAQIPWFTYYMILQASGVQEGSAEVTVAANNQALMARYFADWRFLLQKIGTQAAFLHIEPDFWGYAAQLNLDPHQLPAAVTKANPTDCATEEDSIAGMARCLIHMVRVYAPNAKVGLHASAWGTKIDVLGNTNPALDVAGEANKLGDFLTACGAGGSDFLAVESSDRDAGYYQSIGRSTWWDATNATLPNFHQAFAWAKALAERVGKPVFWWQMPLGNGSLPNQPNQWKDNRVDYFFGHTGEVAAAHSAGMAFGAGAGDQTTPETDGGNFVAKVNAYYGAGGQMCQ